MAHCTRLRTIAIFSKNLLFIKLQIIEYEHWYAQINILSLMSEKLSILEKLRLGLTFFRRVKYLLCRGANQLSLFFFSHKYLSKYIYAWYNTLKRTVKHNKIYYLLVRNRREMCSGSLCPVAHCTPLSPTHCQRYTYISNQNFSTY